MEHLSRSGPARVGTGGDRRIPSLDGMRAVALIVVVATHVVLRDEPQGSTVSTVMHHAGMTAVTMFLAVSGFLITLVLMRQYERTGRLAVAAFYRRRIVRLWPALYAVVAVTAVLGALGVLPLSWVNVVSTLTFTTNYIDQQGNDALAHTWSLSLEEQFYLVWPAVILLVGRRRLPGALAVLIAAAPAVRVVSYFALPALRPSALYQFHMRYDAMAAGCLLALMWNHPRVQRFLHTPRAWGWVAAAALALTPVGHLLGGEAFMFTAGYSIEAVALTVLIALGVQHHGSAPGRLLNARVMVATGLASYSIYLWQQMFLLELGGPFRYWPVGVAASLLAGVASYWLLERPVIRHRASTASVPIT